MVKVREAFEFFTIVILFFREPMVRSKVIGCNLTIHF